MNRNLFIFAILAYSLSSRMILAETSELTHSQVRRDGFYIGMATGQLFYSGNDRILFKDGWLVGLKTGYDFMKWFGVEAVFKFSGHSSLLRGSSTSNPGGFFVDQYALALKGHIPVTKRLSIELGAGAGLFDSHPNQMPAEGGAARGMGYGELGLQYYTRIRGVSIGLDPNVTVVQNLKAAVFQATGFLRYTF